MYTIGDSTNRIYNGLLHLNIIIVFFCVFIIPTFTINGLHIEISKYIFSAYSLFVFCLFLINRMFTINELILSILIVFTCIFIRNFNSIGLISVVNLLHFININKARKIYNYLYSSNIFYLSFAFTIFYTLINCIITKSLTPELKTAVGEVNMSGLANFLLGVMILKKRKILGLFVLLFGLTSCSRNYMLALIIFFIGSINRDGVKKATIILRNSFLLKFKYCIIVCSLIILSFGFLFQYFNAMQIVKHKTGIARLFNFFDISNSHRFYVNVIFANVLIREDIKHLIFGLQNWNVYKEKSHDMAKQLGMSFVGNAPHNFLFSYLRLYGLSAIIIIYSIGLIIDKIVTVNNFKVYVPVLLYAIFMSAGFNSYWLYLTSFALIFNNNSNITIKSEGYIL